MAFDLDTCIDHSSLASKGVLRRNLSRPGFNCSRMDSHGGSIEVIPLSAHRNFGPRSELSTSFGPEREASCPRRDAWNRCQSDIRKLPGMGRYVHRTDVRVGSPVSVRALGLPAQPGICDSPSPHSRHLRHYSPRTPVRFRAGWSARLCTRDGWNV